MSDKVIVAGVGMHRFRKPGASEPYDVMAQTAINAALADAGLAFGHVQQAYASYVYGDSTSGQRALYGVGRSGIPVINVNNNCASGATALFLARQAVAGGAAHCVLAFGFEQMRRGALTEHWDDRPGPLSDFIEATRAAQGWDEQVPMAAQIFGGAGREHMRRFGTRPETFARIAVKARRHAANNPGAVFNEPVTLEEVLASPTIFDPLTRLQCCPPTCGAAAAVLVSPEFARHIGLERGVAIAGQSLVTDRDESFTEGDLRWLVGYGMGIEASERAYEMAGIGPEDVDVVELHDCFTTNELIAYEALGLVPEGEGERMVMDGDNTYGGRVVVNPSGGLLAKGHPLGATGLAQCAELVCQLRGEAGARQVEGARIGLQHNIGLGGACVVTVFESPANDA
ncbi:MAG TPA: lipid-transfer protein [Rhodocyclaceae bacterium]|nr:lipid-transfer protein [Rhodocyclaceae bacterium]